MGCTGKPSGEAPRLWLRQESRSQWNWRRMTQGRSGKVRRILSPQQIADLEEQLTHGIKLGRE